MSRVEVKVLGKLLKALQRTIDETRSLTHLFGPLDKLSEKQSGQLEQASLYLASSMRRSVDVVFDAMEGKLHDHHLWKTAVHNAHNYVTESVCRTLGHHKPWFCHEGKKHLGFHWRHTNDEL
eukprot:Gregarina_sp_Poly_1__7165@NODE_392_length_8959_cov_63_078835_g321_i0_p12_GENE_NODE_392_length_8959_cov_63_078835_g321_i0NODE_392_length_8959_cov_63_078835_g321_i0_p12_ORF_typecomplete_len122_score18_29PEX11/PF05648_14/0_14_NODE_392_length_8959_cov_63_078835_g321_i0184549